MQVLAYTTDPQGKAQPTVITNGIEAEVLLAGEDQTMVDLGLVKDKKPRWINPALYGRLLKR